VARSFASASSEYLSRASTIISGTPFTMACWARVSSTTAGQAFMSINASSGSNRHQLSMNATGNVNCLTNLSGVNYTSSTSGAISANTWAHCAGVWASSSSRTAYLNGTAATPNPSDVTPTSLTTTLLAARRDGTIGLYLNGQLAECCIWSVDLNEDEIKSLANGLRAFQVRPNSILAYWPLGGHFGEVDEDFSGGGHLLTANNTPTWSALYPPIIITPVVTPINYATNVTLDLDAIAATTTVYEPTIAAKFALALDNIAATTTVYGPTLTPGAVSISVPLIAATTTVYQPGINAGGLSIDVDTIGPNTTVYEPTLTPGPVSVALDVIGATTTVYEPDVASGATIIALDTIAPTTQVYQPDVYNTLQQLDLPVIAPTTQVYGPTVATTSNDTSDILKRRKRTRKEIEEENIAVQLLTKQRAETLEEPGSRKQIKIDLKTQQNQDQVVDASKVIPMSDDQFAEVGKMVEAYKVQQIRNKRIRTLLLLASMED